jgi:hypothetical protein
MRSVLIVCVNKYYYGDQTKEDGMGGACSMHDSDEKCIQKFDRNTWR